MHFFYQNKFEVPDSEIPEIVKRSHYGEPDPNQKGNWRGRNNNPDAAYTEYTKVLLVMVVFVFFFCMFVWCDPRLLN